MYKRTVAFCLAACLTAPAFSGCTVPKYGPLSDEQVTLLQFEELVPGEELAVVETTAGSFTMRFFPSEAPNAVENFTSLAKQGFYDGKSVYAIAYGGKEEIPVSFLSGSTDGGVSGKSVFGGESFAAEISTNLWPFSGAVAAISGQKGRADSRFFVTADAEVTDALAKEMEQNGYPPKVVEKFKEVGGVPQYALNYAIFAQVVDGMDVVREILQTPCDEDGIPTEEVSILTITFEKYSGETVLK